MGMFYEWVNDVNGFTTRGGFSHFSLSSALGKTALRVLRWHTSGSLSHVALSSNGTVDSVDSRTAV